MSEITYKIILQLKSPMQIGAGTLGMIEKTELFIPDRVIWGAFISNVIESIFVSPSKEKYIEAGEKISPKCFSTFFPSLDEGKTCYKPIFIDNETKYLCSINKNKYNEEKEMLLLSEQALRDKMVVGVTSNATDPQKMATYDESLHATDLISPFVKNSEDKKLESMCFVGYAELPKQIIIEDKSIQINEKWLEKKFNRMRLGGGRKRGWGIIEVKEINIESTPINFEKFNYKGCDYSTKLLPVKKYPNVVGRTLLAVFRQFDNIQNKGSGRNFSDPELMWNIGACIYEQNLSR